MKYIKTYEKVKNKIKIDIELRNKLNQLIPGMFIIYTRHKLMDWKTGNTIDVLSLARIRETRVQHYYNNYGEEDGLYTDVYLNVIDHIASGNAGSIPLGDNWFKIDEVLKNKLYMTSSFNDAQSKFEELKSQYYENWEIEKNINKFNL